MKNAASKLLHGVVLLVHNTREPNRQEWDDYLAAVVKARDAVGRDLARFRQIVFTDGGGPNWCNAQRTSRNACVRLLRAYARFRGSQPT